MAPVSSAAARANNRLKAVEAVEERLFSESDVNGRESAAGENSPIESTDSVH